MAPDDDKTQSYVPLTNGTMVSHYRIIEKIGAGGMGEVYLAEDTELKRRVALKFLPPHLCQDVDCRARFKREAQAAAKLNHPNIVTIYEVSEFNGRPFFAMEHLEGQSLRELIKQKDIPLSQAIQIAIQLCEGLQEAHSNGIIHRDIKPSNITCDEKGHCKILDFGLAAVHGGEHLTKTGSTLGTVGYVSPEQARGEQVDARSDLFSFGVVLYEIVTGRSPFKAESEVATIQNVIEAVPEPLARYKAGVPDDLQRIVDKLLSKAKDLRYQHAEELASDLKHLVSDSQLMGHRPLPKPAKSRLRMLIGTAAVILVAIGAVLVYQRLKSTQSETAGVIPMIAVLPFDNLGNPDDKYFADGMTLEIISRLGGIEGLGVISRTSAIRYERSGKSASQIGKELGVDYILEGAVRWEKTGGQARVRITPELIRASDDRHLWADNYEREIMGVFAVQEDIAAKIVSELGVKLVDADRRGLAVRPTTNAMAYDFYLRGIGGLRQDYRNISALRATAANLDSAVMLDPSFALAYACRSYAYSRLSIWSVSPESVKLARESFEKALQLQPNLSYGHLAAGVYYNLVEADYEQAMTELDRAFSELHGDADVMYNIGLVQFRLGRFEEADESFQKASDLDPLNPFLHDSRFECFYYRRMLTEAQEAIDRAIAVDPERPESYGQKIALLVSQYGDWNRMSPIVREALGHVDTVQFVNMLLLDWQVWGYSIDSVLRGNELLLGLVLDRIRNNRQLNPELYQSFWALSEGYRASDKANLAAQYLDSTRAELEEQIKTWENNKNLEQTPDYAHRFSNLGLVLAELGWCQQAELVGKRGKDLLSINKCHW